MKKLLLILCVFFLSVGLTACDPNTGPDDGGNTDNTDSQDKLDVKADLATLETLLDSPITNFTLPRSGDKGTSFSYTSDDLIIGSNGAIVQNRLGLDDLAGVVNVKAVKGDYSEEKSISIKVKALSEVSIESKKTLDFHGKGEEYIVSDSTLDIYYGSDSELPYVNIEDFLDVINGAIQSNELEYTSKDNGNTLKVSYTVEYEDETTEEYFIELDFADNTIFIPTFDFFSGYGAPTTTDFGNGLLYTGFDYTEPNETTIDLKNYGFDLVPHDETGVTKYLMPLHLANLFFLSDTYYDVYYNGDDVYGIDTYQVYGSTEADEAVMKEIRTSSLNGTNASTRFLHQNFNYLVLALDYFYGLKEYKGIESFYDYFGPSYTKFIGGSNLAAQNLFKFTHEIDDLHTSHQWNGYFVRPTTSYSDGKGDADLRGPVVASFYGHLQSVFNLQIAAFGGRDKPMIPAIRYIDNQKTAIFYFTSFTATTPDVFKDFLDKLPNSVENVIIDLTYNTGGNVGAVFRMFGYMTEKPFNYHSMNPKDGSAYSYQIESEYVAFEQYNFIIMTSGVTFSAANLMASMAKEIGFPVIGKQSSGGACSISVISLPDGGIIMVSSNNMLASVEYDNGEKIYKDVEGGVPVDYTVNGFYNEQEVINAIKEVLK
ncbi:hypothetical protein LJC17_00080 [Acholeplasma sp. OttesenSCG-928-E16]|nr:hypothetical protein [Acholeplasma sp. OttesenSCG-928-E16]